MLITKTTSHGEYRAPNTVILTRAVKLTARALQKAKFKTASHTMRKIQRSLSKTRPFGVIQYSGMVAYRC